ALGVVEHAQQLIGAGREPNEHRPLGPTLEYEMANQCANHAGMIVEAQCRAKRLAGTEPDERKGDRSMPAGRQCAFETSGVAADAMQEYDQCLGILLIVEIYHGVDDESRVAFRELAHECGGQREVVLDDSGARRIDASLHEWPEKRHGKIVGTPPALFGILDQAPAYDPIETRGN